MGSVEPSLLGRTIAGKFEIESFIGRGAMGEVYKARQIALEKTVAIKVLHKDLARDGTFATRFHREAKAASRLDHPNSVRVIDFGADPDGLLYIVMEHLDGRDLLKVLQEDWPLSPARIAGLLSQTLAALGVAHDMGVIHRDLKPENIMILGGTDDEGQRTDIVKVCDFGIAKLTTRVAASHDTGRGPITTQGVVVGTPEYMSPEQGKGESLDPRSDLYSMGVILFQLLTGRLPFEAETALGIVLKHVTEEPPRPSSIHPAVDPTLESVCLRALRKDRDQRYQTAREMRAHLRGIAGSTPSAVLTPPPMASPPMFETAQTVSQDRLSDAGGPDARSTVTPSGTMALPELPVERSRLWPLLGAGALVGAGIATFALLSRTPSPPVVSEEPLAAVVVAAAAPPPSATPGPSAVVASAPSVPPSAKPLALKHKPASEAVTPPRSAGAAVPPAASASAASFDPASASVSLKVLTATGVPSHDVRSALPSWQFTQCYRDALSRVHRRLEGRVVVGLTLDAGGRVVRANASGPESLLTNVGSCLNDALNQLPVKNATDPAATADVELVFTPE